MLNETSFNELHASVMPPANDLNFSVLTEASIRILIILRSYYPLNVTTQRIEGNYTDIFTVSNKHPKDLIIEWLELAVFLYFRTF